MSKLVRPHGGGDLKPLLLEGQALATEKKRAEGLKKVNVSSREAGDIIMMGIGGFTPLTGFMTRADWLGVCDGMKMASGLFWPIPITLSTDKAAADGIKEGEDVALFDPERNEILATMKITEKYTIDKAHECMQVYKTTDLEHPGVRMVMAQGDVNLAGPIKVLSTGGFKEEYGEQFMTPAETRAAFEKLGWSRVAAFQTRNPMHRSHEYLAKIAIETMDGVLVHSLLGALKPGDIPAEVRSEAISVLIENYFAPNTVIQAGYPLDMRYAGPREALLHALFRQNYGCSHLIVGRDHAGVGRLLRPVRCAEDLRRDPQRRARNQEYEHRLDLLVQQVRRHGLAAHLPAHQGRPHSAVRHQSAFDAVRRSGSAGRIQPPRSCQGAAEILCRSECRAERESGTQGPLSRLR
jgi:sulfate adenylyltransferase